jgi:hypothetical protein
LIDEGQSAFNRTTCISSSRVLEDEIIPMPMFQYELLHAIFEWVRHHFFFFKDTSKVFRSSIKTYDRNWLSCLDRDLGVNAFKLMNTANYLGIEILIEVVRAFIAETHEERSFRLIEKAFFYRTSDSMIHSIFVKCVKKWVYFINTIDI